MRQRWLHLALVTVAGYAVSPVAATAYTLKGTS